MVSKAVNREWCGGLRHQDNTMPPSPMRLPAGVLLLLIRQFRLLLVRMTLLMASSQYGDVHLTHGGLVLGAQTIGRPSLASVGMMV